MDVGGWRLEVGASLMQQLISLKQLLEFIKRELKNARSAVHAGVLIIQFFKIINQCFHARDAQAIAKFDRAPTSHHLENLINRFTDFF